MTNDRTILRDLAQQYQQVTQQPVMDERRELWRRHNSLEKTRSPINVRMGYWNHFCKDLVDGQMQCVDPFFRQHERALRVSLFHAQLGDDFIFEPWLTLEATQVDPGEGMWGLNVPLVESEDAHGSYKWEPPLKELSDVAKLKVADHKIDEAATARNLARLQEAVGDIIEIIVDRGPLLRGCDISNNIAQLRGMEPLMLDMFDNPKWLHGLLAYMRDGILKNHEQAEQAGHWQTAHSFNQAMSYSRGTLDPKPAQKATRKQIWTFMASQEYTLVSPAQQEEFLLQYQIPILEKFALCAYGCCEDLTQKIGTLRKIRNLRRIAVTPRANLAKCAEQIGRDYVISWRPNPAGAVCCGFEIDRIRKTAREGLDICRGLNVDIILKDVETVEGHLERLGQWVQTTREVAEHYA